jgi:hypothetical protein
MASQIVNEAGNAAASRRLAPTDYSSCEMFMQYEKINGRHQAFLAMTMQLSGATQ